MNETPTSTAERSAPLRKRLPSAIIYLATFLIVAYGGLWIHVHILPLPVESVGGGIARYIYFLLWLVALIYLSITILYGHTFRKSQRAVHFVVGLFLGYVGGFYFAGHLGMLVGLISGLLTVQVTFRIRKKRDFHRVAREPVRQKDFS
jgi:hypothetical protein